MADGTGVKGVAVPQTGKGAFTFPRMAKKKPEDREIENRVRGHVRREMVARGWGVNKMGRKLGLYQGSLSKILSEQRGVGSGFILIVQRALHVPSSLLLEEDPEARFMAPGVPDVPEEPSRRQ